MEWLGIDIHHHLLHDNILGNDFDGDNSLGTDMSADDIETTHQLRQGELSNESILEGDEMQREELAEASILGLGAVSLGVAATFIISHRQNLIQVNNTIPIDKLPYYNVHEQDVKYLENQECTICLESFRTGDNIRILPCFHQYHKKCIDTWLGQEETCPICKSSISID